MRWKHGLVLIAWVQAFQVLIAGGKAASSDSFCQVNAIRIVACRPQSSNQRQVLGDRWVIVVDAGGGFHLSKSSVELWRDVSAARWY